MKKSILNIKGAQELSKENQKNVSGGMWPTLSDCPRGCFGLFIGDPGSNRCAVPSPSGAACFGTVQNGQCCL